MSGKKAQRTKGNTQPSSSSRSAKFLQHEGQSALITFSGLAGNTSGISSQEIGDASSLDAEMRLLLRKMAKKDAVTKLKAMQEFTLLCKEKDSDAVKNILNCWPRLYGKLAHDFDHRVREATQQAHYQLTTKAGRNLAPHLKQLIVNWLMSHFDNHTPAASNAKMSFDQVFQEKKKKEVLTFCKKEILQACEKNILRETADTLSDPKMIPLEEREAKYNRFVSSTFLVLRYFLENSELIESDDDIKEQLASLVGEKKFWKFAKHESPMIRTSFFILLLTLCEKSCATMEGALHHMGAAVLTNLDEQDSVVTKPLWDVLLYCLSAYQNLWQFVNVRKAVWPNLWKLLNAGCYGNINIVYPNLLPFLSHVSAEVAGEGTVFYTEFFNHIANISVTKSRTLTDNDSVLVITTYMECTKFLLMKNTNNKQLCNFIITDLIAEKLRCIFYSNDDRSTLNRVFLRELQLLLSHLHNEASKSSENECFDVLYSRLWSVVCDVIFTQSDDRIKFKHIESEDGEATSNETKECFYTSLIDFISFCYESLPVTNIPDCVAYSGNSAELFSMFLRKVVKCYVTETFNMSEFSTGKQLMKFVSLSFHIDLIKCICLEKFMLESNGQILDEATDVDVCITFVNSIVLPLLKCGVKYVDELVKVTIGLITILRGSEKREYLVSLFERNVLSGSALLSSFVEVFRYCQDEYVLEWLKSDFVEKEIIEIMRTVKSEEGSDEQIKLTWEILKMYIEVVKEKPDKLLEYHAKLLELIKDCVAQGETIDDSAFSTLASLCTSSSLSLSDLCVETWFVIFERNIVCEESSSSTDAMNTVFEMFMCHAEDFHLRNITNKWVEFANTCGSVDRICANFCNTMCSLIQLAGNHSNASGTSYGTLLLQEIIRSIDEENVGTFNIYSQLLKNVSLEDVSLLEACCDGKLYNVILRCFAEAVAERDTDASAMGVISECIQKCEFMHFGLVEDAVQKCLQNSIKTHTVKELLQMFLENNLLSESIVDCILMLTSPANHNYKDIACDAYCMVVSTVNDISCVRALVEMYVDELRNNGEVTNDGEIFGQFVKILSSVISRWYEMLNSLEIDLQDYDDVICVILTSIIIWKDDHSEMLLFSNSLVDIEESIISLNVQLIRLVHQCVHTALGEFRADQWDFLLCSMISWVQSCEESLDCFETQPSYTHFMLASFQLFNTIACMFDSSPVSTSTCIFSPSIFLKETPALNVPSLTEDTTTEWKELFLPTASTSILRIYMNLISTRLLDSRNVEFEQTLCRCIRFIPPSTLHEFACGGHENDTEKQKAIESFCSACCQILSSGNWWNKIASYQLLTGLGELIESKLCYIAQDEDEEHQGMRSFPDTLIETMESSRDETLEVLSAQCVSIKDPLTTFEHKEGKSALLTYLLSWQLMLQIFKMADPSNRALFANYFHSNSDVHDLVTCLFCLMSQAMNLENKKKVILLQFTFPEIRQMAFHLLTTSMQCIPALIRNWFNNHLSRVDTGTVNKFVSNFISPILLNNEFQNLNESSKEFNNMVVKTRAAAREIAAVYTVDEVSMELVVQLGANHPLSPVSVTCGKRIGVSNSLWRQWMLQLNTFLSFQNGSILDGLALWKRNVDKRFEGVEECMVCFSVLHGSNYSLPTMGCKTCKKKFHPACLYKWFNTSGKCTCPLCRNIF